VSLIVAAAAAAAAAIAVGVTLATRQSPAPRKSRPGKPTPVLVLPSPAAGAIRAAFTRWPKGSLDAMQELARRRPRDPVVLYNLGVALYWAGYSDDAVAAFRATKRVGPDTPYAIQADTLLHPSFFQGAPVFQQLRPDPELRRGILLQLRGRRLSAERLYAAAARARPGDDEAQVAAAVALFDKDRLGRSFGRLGPLTRRFPHSQSVRFHLGLLLAWTGQRDAAKAQFERARALGPRTVLGREANTFLLRLVTR
jgi:tetratricopeptide (TPR) repeat protein